MDNKTIEKSLELLGLLNDSAFFEGLGKNLIVLSRLSEVGFDALIEGARRDLSSSIEAPKKLDPLVRISVVEETLGVCWKTAKGILDRYEIEVHGNGRGQRVLQSDLAIAQEKYLEEKRS